MFATSNSCLLRRSFLMRLLQTTGLSLALMTASAVGVHADNVYVQGSRLVAQTARMGSIRAIAAGRAVTGSR